MTSSLVFAFGAGLLAPVNPCGFAMLPAFLGWYAGAPEPGESSGSRGISESLAQGLGVGAAVSVGFAGVYVLAGLLVSAGLRRLMDYVPWAAVVIGTVLVGIGLAMLAGRHVGLRVAGLRPGQGRSPRRMVLFGISYATASLSCSLAILLAVVGRALATDSPLTTVGVLLAYGAGSATLVTALAVSAAVAKGTLASVVRQTLPIASRLGGALLVLSGAYLVAYWLPVVTGSRLRSGVTDVPGDPSARLTTFVDANRGWFALIGLALLAVAVPVLMGHRRNAADTTRAGGRGEKLEEPDEATRHAATRV